MALLRRTTDQDIVSSAQLGSAYQGSLRSADARTLSAVDVASKFIAPASLEQVLVDDHVVSQGKWEVVMFQADRGFCLSLSYESYKSVVWAGTGQLRHAFALR